METPGKIISGLIAAATALYFGTAYVDSTERDDKGQIVTAGDLGVFKLNIGDCVNDLSTTGEIESVTGVPCAQPHRWEAYDKTQVNLGTYDEPTVVKAAETFCTDSYDKNVFPNVQRMYDQAGAEQQKTLERIEMTFLYPTTESWDQDDREVTCFVGNGSDFVVGKYRS